MEETMIKIFTDSDIKKSGGFKKKNNIVEMGERQFIDYVKEKNLSITKGYIDNIGFLSNGQKFSCRYKNMMVGVTGVMERAENE